LIVVLAATIAALALAWARNGAVASLLDTVMRQVRGMLGCWLMVRCPPGEGGSATVELAAAIPLLVAVALAMVALVGVALGQVVAQGAAREGAREAALSGDHARAVAAARAALPAGRPARVAVVAAAGRARVEVALPVRLLPGVSPVTVRAAAVAAVEPGPAPAPTEP